MADGSGKPDLVNKEAEAAAAEAAREAKAEVLERRAKTSAPAPSEAAPADGRIKKHANASRAVDGGTGTQVVWPGIGHQQQQRGQEQGMKSHQVLPCQLRLWRGR